MQTFMVVSKTTVNTMMIKKCCNSLISPGAVITASKRISPNIMHTQITNESNDMSRSTSAWSRTCKAGAGTGTGADADTGSIVEVSMVWYVAGEEV